MTRAMIHTFVPGRPIPQGSVDVYGGRIVSVKAPLRVIQGGKS